MGRVDLFLIILYVLCALIFATFGKIRKRKSWIKIFLITLFLTPVTSSIILFRKKREKITYVVNRYKCPRCEFKYDTQLDHCPYCEKEGHIIALEEVSQIMT
ncbi:MAG: hypothetical protein GX437_05565 [Sphingobacteriales bacterium]|nr:hypothetical protein [Sphingobacteriales bacterium]